MTPNTEDDRPFPPISISTDPAWLLGGLTVAGEPIDPVHVSIGESIENLTDLLRGRFGGAFRQIAGNHDEWPGVTITTTAPVNGSFAVRLMIHEVRQEPSLWIALRPGAPFGPAYVRFGP